jgi:hypothetical protein
MYFYIGAHILGRRRFALWLANGDLEKFAGLHRSDAALAVIQQIAGESRANRKLRRSVSLASSWRFVLPLRARMRCRRGYEQA